MVCRIYRVLGGFLMLFTVLLRVLNFRALGVGGGGFGVDKGL